MLRVAGDPHSYISAVSSKIAELDPDIPLFDMSSLDDRITLSTAYARFEALLLTAFSIAALLLAAVGLFATLSQMVARRTFEIGVRVALGAQPAHVFRLIVQRAFVLAVIGVAIGFAAYCFVARLYSDLLFAVSPLDPWATVIATAVLLSTTFLASLYPARRAMRLDPIQSLRDQ